MESCTSASPPGPARIPRLAALRSRLRPIVGRELWSFLDLLTLTGFVVAQPLLDVLGRSPDFLLFRQADGGDGDAFPPLGQPVGGAVPVELGEFFYRALFDKRRSLDGTRVRLLGFVTPRHDRGAAYVLTRFQMFCCAADAEVVEVAIHGDATPRAAEQWLLVEGHWRSTPAQHAAAAKVDDIPVLVADTVTPVAPPRDRYEHGLFGY